MSIVISGSVAFGPRTVTDDLVFLIDALNPKSGQGDTVWNDLIQGVTGSLSGITYTQDGGESHFEYFNTGSYARYVDEESIQNIFDGGGTIECWCYPEDNDPDIRVWMDKSQASSNGWKAYINSTRYVLFHQNFSTLDGVFSTSNAVLLFNRWHHLSLVYNSDSSTNAPTVYVNGIPYVMPPLGRVTGTRDSDIGVLLEIGTQGEIVPAAEYWDGRIARASIYNRILTAAEIQQNFQALRARYGI